MRLWQKYIRLNANWSINETMTIEPINLKLISKLIFEEKDNRASIQSDVLTITPNNPEEE